MTFLPPHRPVSGPGTEPGPRDVQPGARGPSLPHDASFSVMMTVSHREKVSLHLVSVVEENREVASTFFFFLIFHTHTKMI